MRTTRRISTTWPSPWPPRARAGRARGMWSTRSRPSGSFLRSSPCGAKFASAVTPRLLALLLLCLGLTARADEAERPSRADMQKVLELYERSVVRVHGPRRAGPGVIVGSAGQVLTSVDHVSLETADVEFNGQRVTGSVML